MMKKTGFKSLKELRDERVVLRIFKAQKKPLTKEQYTRKAGNIAFLMCISAIALQYFVMGLVKNSIESVGVFDHSKYLLGICAILYLNCTLRPRWDAIVKAKDMAKITFLRAVIMFVNFIANIMILTMSGELDITFVAVWAVLGLFEPIRLSVIFFKQKKLVSTV